MDQQTRIVELIERALESFGSRDLVSGAEVLDFLLISVSPRSSRSTTPRSIGSSRANGNVPHLRQLRP